jgi:hypothetical protein
MADDKIRISWGELKTSKVEKQVRQQQAMARNRRYAELTTDDLPVTRPTADSFWNNAVVLLCLFGLVGGMIGWSALALLHLRPDQKQQADQIVGYIRDIKRAEGIGPVADTAIKNLLIDAGDNAYLAVELNEALSPGEKQVRIDRLARADRWRDTFAYFVGYGICGMAISICLSIAEPLTSGNYPAVVRNGWIGALLGLLGGVCAAGVIVWVNRAVGDAGQSRERETLSLAASWGTLGCFTAIAPGIIAWNWKRFIIGVAGGLIGGLCGGLLMELATRTVASEELGKLVAICCIGLISGAATGIIELAARTGWLKVTAGFIAGKQFILYRNPTFIGSAPDCQIYLFRDPAVGRRHAALHLLKGRVELEDLPLGGATVVNGSPITRKSLKDGDEIKIGVTTFLFQMREDQTSA